MISPEMGAVEHPNQWSSKTPLTTVPARRYPDGTVEYQYSGAILHYGPVPWRIADTALAATFI